MITTRLCENKQQWDEEIINRGGHPLQLWGWGEVKSAHNWSAVRVFVMRDEEVIGAAQILKRRLPAPLTALAYIPRGPVADENERGVVLEALASFVRTEMGAVVLTVEPDWKVMPAVAGWRQTSNTILIPQTLILDLAKTEDELMADMAKKTRQYIRKSTQETIEIRRVTDREELDGCLDIYEETARRAGFALHGRQYYYDMFEMMGDYSPVFAVFSGSKAIAFLWLAISGTTAFELYGGMDDQGQRLRVNYALKWHAIRTAKKWGIERYDFNGLLNDGVSTFKRGFAGHEDLLAGTYDKPLSQLYILWSKGLPLMKRILRSVKR